MSLFIDLVNRLKMFDKQKRKITMSSEINTLSALILRVWRTIRKIFLYPENWIKPDQRDNKSPSFKEADDELLGTDTTRNHDKPVHKNDHEEND